MKLIAVLSKCSFLLSIGAAAALSACTSASETGDGPQNLFDDQRAWKVSFGDVSPSDVAAFEALIVRGSCAGSEEVDKTEVSGDGKGVTPTGLESGSYAIIVRARDEECRIIAAGCSAFEVPAESTGVLEVRIEPTRPRFACSASQCMAGSCSGGGGSSSNTGNTQDPDGSADIDSGANDAGTNVTDGGMVEHSVIYDIKKGLIALNSIVDVEGIVTAADSSGLFVQVPEADHQPPDYAYQFSGLYVHVADSSAALPTPKVGQKVSIRGRVQNFHGQIQMHAVESMSVIASAQTVPTPQVANPVDLATGGALASAFEGALVRVERASVDEAVPPPTQSDTAKNEFGVGGGLRVNDLFYVVSPRPEKGTVMSITGILRLSHDNSKVEPRGPADIEYHLTLKGFSEPYVCAPNGLNSASSTPPLRVLMTSKAPVGGALVMLSSSSVQVQVPSNVMVPAGASSIEVLLTTTGATTTPATITASFDGGVATTQVTVQAGNEVKLAAISPPETMVPYQGTASLTATLNCPAPAEGVEYTVASDSSAVSVGGSLRFAAGEREKSVQVTGSGEGAANISISRVADALSARVAVQTIKLSEVFYDPEGLDTGLEWVEIYNPTNLAVDLSKYTLGYTDNTSLADFKAQLSGTMEPGACLVVGGGPATLGLTLGMQNADGRADGVALFQLTANLVTKTSLPVDYMMYGPEDTVPVDSKPNNIVDASGKVLPPDVRGPNDGQSVERTPTGWQVQIMPTPGNCSALSSL